MLQGGSAGNKIDKRGRCSTQPNILEAQPKHSMLKSNYKDYYIQSPGSVQDQRINPGSIQDQSRTTGAVQDQSGIFYYYTKDQSQGGNSTRGCRPWIRVNNQLNSM